MGEGNARLRPSGPLISNKAPQRRSRPASDFPKSQRRSCIGHRCADNGRQDQIAAKTPCDSVAGPHRRPNRREQPPAAESDARRAQAGARARARTPYSQGEAIFRGAGPVLAMIADLKARSSSGAGHRHALTQSRNRRRPGSASACVLRHIVMGELFKRIGTDSTRARGDLPGTSPYPPGRCEDPFGRPDAIAEAYITQAPHLRNLPNRPQVSQHLLQARTQGRRKRWIRPNDGEDPLSQGRLTAPCLSMDPVVSLSQ